MVKQLEGEFIYRNKDVALFPCRFRKVFENYRTIWYIVRKDIKRSTLYFQTIDCILREKNLAI